MKYVKMLGLVAVAAAALMAFVGASTASATVLCKEVAAGTPTGTKCAEGQAYEKGQEIHAVNEGNAVLTTGSSFTEITCKKSTVKGITENEGGVTETVKGESPKAAEEITFSECSTPSGACTVTSVSGGTLEVHWIEGTHNGTVTSNGAIVTSNCASIFGNIHCIYKTANTDLGTLTGGNPATMDIESAAIGSEETNGLCPATSKWDAKYEVTTPKPLFVAGHT